MKRGAKERGISKTLLYPTVFNHLVDTQLDFNQYFSLFLTDFLLISIHQLEPSRNTTLKHSCRIILLAHLLQELQVLGAV